jgi:hypothetical protein
MTYRQVYSLIERHCERDVLSFFADPHSRWPASAVGHYVITKMGERSRELESQDIAAAKQLTEAQIAVRNHL